MNTTTSNLITVVSGRPGIRDRSKPLCDVVKNARELSYPTMPLPEHYQESIRHLSESALGHRTTDTGIMLSVIVFPVHEPNHPKLMGISLQHAASAKAKPLLCSGTCAETQRLMTALCGDEHTLEENVYASIAPFRGKRVLCLVPENHPFERQILACLDIETTPIRTGMERLFFQTKVFGKGGSYTQSRCGVSHPMFRMWFPRQSCADIREDIDKFYPTTTTTRQRAPKVPAPKGVTKKVSASTSSPAARGKGLCATHTPGMGKRLYTPGMGKRLMGQEMVGQVLPEAGDTYKHVMGKLISARVSGEESIDDADWVVSICSLSMLRDACEEQRFRQDMFHYRDMEAGDIIDALVEDQKHLTARYRLDTTSETITELGEVLRELST